MSNASRAPLMVVLAIIFFVLSHVAVYDWGTIPLIGEYTHTTTANGEEEWSIEFYALGAILPVALAYLITGRRGFRWMYGWVIGSLFGNDD